MRLRAAVAVVVVATAVAVVAPGLALGQSDTGAAVGPAPTAGANTTIAIHPRPDGDARFRVSLSFDLDDRNDTTAFRALGRDFEGDSPGVSLSTFRWAANESSVVTGRAMNVTNVTHNATVVGENTSRTTTGNLVLGFTWTNFTRTSGARVALGDAFATTRGTWLPGLAANQTLVIDSPPGYAVARSPVGFTNGTLQWEGPASFAPGSPAVTFRRRGPAGTPDGGDSGTGMLGSMPVALGAAVLSTGIVAFGAYVLIQRDRDDRRERAGDGGAAPDEATVDEGSATSSDPDATDANAARDGPDEAELLSDEERVERLLEHNDGRMRQASIVTETGWSNAKVSQLLSAMEETGRVDKLRIGRENLISLPEEE